MEQNNNTPPRIDIRPLLVSDAESLAQLLNSAPAAYSRYFTPFRFDRNTIASLIEKASRDIYNGIFIGIQIVGFYMLRGFDQGYDIPSYGVWIAPQFEGLGLAKLSLSHAVTTCRILDCHTLMLKVHPKNEKAKQIYLSAGFQEFGRDSKNDNLILHKTLRAQ